MSGKLKVEREGEKVVPGTVDVTTQSFETEVLKATVPVAVDFWAEWCGPCKMIAPIMQELAREFQGKVKVAKVNVDDYPELASSYNVMNIPTLILFKGGKEAGRIVGFTSKKDLSQRFTQLSSG